MKGKSKVTYLDCKMIFLSCQYYFTNNINYENVPNPKVTAKEIALKGLYNSR